DIVHYPEQHRILVSIDALDPHIRLFFFQAEDGIRDFHVTGVQTCALPIWVTPARIRSGRAPGDLAGGVQHLDARLAGLVHAQADAVAALRIGEQDLGVLVVVLDRDA